MKKILIVLWFCLLPFSSFAESSLENSYWGDLKESMSLMVRGSYLQFTTKNNLYYAAAGVPLVAYSFEHDKRIQSRYGGSEIRNIVDHVGDGGVIFNFPLLHLGFYAYGKKYKNNHHVQFAKEYLAAMYLALFESGLLSYVSVHERPSTQNSSFWEKEFRGSSSWPSGHVIPYMTLFFKTMQFYGPKWAALPLALSIMSGMQRIQDQKHWLSDITASFVISAWASEGVRKAAGYRKNHPFYKWAFEHNAVMGVANHRGAIGPQLMWNY